MPFQFEAEGATDRGRVRSENQDAFLVDAPHGLFVVADGMGGHAGGEIASRVCIEQVQAYLHAHPHAATTSSADASSAQPSPQILQHMRLAVNTASSTIYDRALEDPSLRGMGTTATVLQVHANTAYCAHVGDSRLYLIRCGFIYQLTSDHSLVSEQVAAGLLTEDEARHHQLRNVITRSVGYQEEELVDTLAFPLQLGDLLLLCSDGLHGRVGDQEIAHLTIERGPQAVYDLIDLANERGGDDNITVIVVKVTRAS